MERAPRRCVITWEVGSPCLEFVVEALEEACEARMCASSLRSGLGNTFPALVVWCSATGGGLRSWGCTPPSYGTMCRMGYRARKLARLMREVPPLGDTGTSSWCRGMGRRLLYQGMWFAKVGGGLRWWDAHLLVM